MSQSAVPLQDAFERELLAAVPFMRAFARSLCRDHEQAEDIAQETLLKAWQCREQFQPGTNLRAWLSTILRNRYYSGQRRLKWRAEFDADVIERTLMAPDDPSVTVELEDVRRALARQCLGSGDSDRLAVGIIHQMKLEVNGIRLLP